MRERSSNELDNNLEDLLRIANDIPSDQTLPEELQKTLKEGKNYVNEFANKIQKQKPTIRARIKRLLGRR